MVLYYQIQRQKRRDPFSSIQTRIPHGVKVGCFTNYERYFYAYKQMQKPFTVIKMVLL